MNKKEYTIDFHEHFYYLKERKKWWIIPYNKVIEFSHDFDYIERKYKELTEQEK